MELARLGEISLPAPGEPTKSGKRIRGGSYREDLKQVELGDVTPLPSSINRHRNHDVFEVLRKEHDEEDGQGRNPPVGPGIIASRIEERQGHEGNGWSDGQGANETHEVADEARETHQHLDAGSHHDSALQLSDPLLPLLGEFRRAGVHQAGIESPLWAFPGRKREHGQRGSHEGEGPSLKNGQPDP